jgi:hypothetical protein
MAGDSGTGTITVGTDTFTIAGGTALSSVASGDGITVSLDNTAVTAASYGSSTAIPTFTVDAQGRLTAAGTVAVSSDMAMAGDTGTGTITVGTDTFTIAGGTNLTSVASGDGITISLDASPALSGTPSAPTAAANTNTTQIATTAYVQTELTDLIGGAPGTLDTLNELAAAINDDASYASTLTTALGTKQAIADCVSTNTANKVVKRDASGNFSAGTITATCTSAQYADLAENYSADAEYAPGTVVCFGGDAEVTQCNEDGDRRSAGVVSTDPAYIMNSTLEGTKATVALQGRVPCMVIGSVKKGDMMVSAGNGMARAEADPKMGSVIGKALEDSEGNATIEVVIGRV